MVTMVQKIEDATCITHSGTMHADEVFATAFLDLYLKDVKVFRTSSVDFDRVSKDALVYDVGRGKFDHHQLDAELRENGIKYSSFGLLWREFGKDYLKKQNYENIDELFIAIDKDFVEGIDGDDNGVFPKIECEYKVKTLPNIIKIFNPSYDSCENENDQFLKAVSLAKVILEEEFIYMNGKVLSDQMVRELLQDVHEEDSYVILEEYFPYEDVLLSCENTKNVLFVAFPSNRGGYAIKTVPKSLEDRTARMEFPEEWAGLCDDELVQVSGIEGLRFCHTARFIVSCNDIESVHRVLSLLCK